MTTLQIIQDHILQWSGWVSNTSHIILVSQSVAVMSNLPFWCSDHVNVCPVYHFLIALSSVTAFPSSKLVQSLPRDISHITIKKAKGYCLAFKCGGLLYEEVAEVTETLTSLLLSWIPHQHADTLLVFELAWMLLTESRYEEAAIEFSPTMYYFTCECYITISKLDKVQELFDKVFRMINKQNLSGKDFPMEVLIKKVMFYKAKWE
ncbi:hypothetical protein ARMGADRAFT_1034098 [Armillaria gallica]|uniref:Uncharacterized protein n=1 Tax=Armillaria gallica TaxID=47427 RepID=A0A2H3D3W9_ARMGA|nr:hypothetical protein ARMGADRAFT_1034098 [Armillaria gallica]